MTMIQHLSIQDTHGFQASGSPDAGPAPVTQAPRGAGQPKAPTKDVNPPVADVFHLQDSAWDDASDGYDDCGDEEQGQTPLVDSLERPLDWALGAYSSLKKIVQQSKGAASKPVTNFIKKYLRGTKLIFVVGQSGTGKSTLLSELSGLEVASWNSHKSGTKNYQVCPAIIDGEQYLFVDTAGFGAADIDNMENFHDIITCLDALSPFVNICGVLFVYGGNQGRMMTPDLTTIQWVKAFCGPQFYNRITVVTTKWDSMSEDDFEEAWENYLPWLLNDNALAEILNPSPVGPRRYHGAAVYHHSIKQSTTNDPSHQIERLSKKRRPEERAEEARSMIAKRYKETTKVKLQVVREMANKTRWDMTEAAKVLQHNPSQIRLEIKNDVVRVSISATQGETPGEQLDEAGRASNAPLPVVASEVKDSQTPSAGNTATTPDTKSPPSAPETKKSHDTSKPNQQRKSPSRPWFGQLFAWLDVAKEAALFFMNSRRERGNNRRTGLGQRSTSWIDTWGSLSSWWSGPPNAPSGDGN